MPPPPIQLFMTTIASQPALRQRQETLLRVLQVKKIPFTSYDLASDEEAKKLWRRKAPLDKQQLPGILIGGKFPGTYADFEEAVEYGELDIFLRLKENYVPSEWDKPAPEAKPVGVPGAYSPSQMNPHHHRPSLSPSPSASPLKSKGVGSKAGVANAKDDLSEYGLHDVDVSVDDLKALVEELGLGGEEANDLVKGLGGSTDILEDTTTKNQSHNPLANVGEGVKDTMPAGEEKPPQSEPQHTKDAVEVKQEVVREVEKK